ncbi:hypothetical protein [Leucothrix arctica]|uniref:Uncharacterized protein n=1 Tax=Leucothrix arctica TaxID=1481894 RepID=A0A317CN70_9GAMM|nr:hypothetical protein [Leucothrix arctica]PWQ99641.1 hypothetical protein DKT75_00795 [Leucothrix arctica]
MKVSLINKILLYLEMIPIMILLILSLFLLLGASGPINILLVVLSISSMVSLINLILKTISGDVDDINVWYIYLAHIGLAITIMGALVLLIDGNGFKSHTPGVPYSAFSFGLVVCVPYLHVMIINKIL